MSGDAPTQFVALFHRAMAAERARAELNAFIEGLSAGDADRCIAGYFDASTDPQYHYSPRDSTSLGVFARLALVAIDRGTPLYSVRFEALVRADRTPWRERFDSLSSPQRSKLLTRATQLQKALNPPQRKLIPLIPRAIEKGHTGEVEGLVSPLSFHEAHSCLLVYLEASQRYPPDEPRSLLLFYGISSLTIRKGDHGFIADYQRLIAQRGTLWNLRWLALSDTQRLDLQKDMNETSIKLKTIQAGKRQGEVPIGVSTPAPEQVRGDAVRRDAPKRTAAYRTFVTLYKQLVRAGKDTDAEKAKKKELSEHIMAQALPGLRDCFAAYVTESPRFTENSAASLYIFWGLTSRLVNLGKGYEALKLSYLKNLPNSIVAQRFAQLPPGDQKALEKEIGNLIALQKRRVLDDVKFAYYKENHTDAELGSLRTYEPDLHPDYRTAVRSAMMDCDRTFRQRDAKAFGAAFDAWTDLVHGQHGYLIQTAMLKWCREMPSISPVLRSELYWYGVLALQIDALRHNPDDYDKGGLNQEEKEFFLAPGLVPQAYREDFEQRLLFVWWKRASPKQLKETSRAHALLLFLAQRAGFALVTMARGKTIRDNLVKLKAEKSKDLEAVRIPVNARNSGESVLLGARLGNLRVVWWNRGWGRAYVERDGCGRVLFEVDSYLQLGRLKREDDTYGKMWRDTEHLLVVIPFFFEVMGYLPDLVSGGFGALVHSVIADMAVEAFAEQAGLGEGATMVLGMAANTLSGHLYEQGVESKGTRVLPDQDYVDELAEQVGKHASHYPDNPVAPPNRANGADRTALDSGNLDSTSRSVPSRLDDAEPTEAPKVPGSRAASRQPPPPPERPKGQKKTATAGEDQDDIAEPKAAIGGAAGAFGDSDKGAGLASKKKSDPTNRPRMQGDERAKPTSAQQDPRGTRGNSGVPPKPAPRGRKPKFTSPYKIIGDINHPALQTLMKQKGWTFEKLPVKQPRTLGGRFQIGVGGDAEWRITTPNKKHFEADFLAVDPDGKLLIGDAKATGAVEPHKSAHIAHWSKKMSPLGRATAIAIESEGLARVEIAASVPEDLKAPQAPVAPEAYYNIVKQQLPRELLEKHMDVLEPYLKSKGLDVSELTEDKLSDMLDELLDISDIEWGKAPKPKDFPEPPDPKEPPTPKKPPKK